MYVCSLSCLFVGFCWVSLSLPPLLFICDLVGGGGGDGGGGGGGGGVGGEGGGGGGIG